MIEKVLERLKHLTHDNPMVTDKYILREDAIEIVQEVAKEYEGRVIELPCKVGDTVYLINHFMVDRKKKPIKCIVDELTIDGSGCYAVLSGSEVFYAMQRFRAVSIKEFGKTVFLTQTEAEETLAKMGGK